MYLTVKQPPLAHVPADVCTFWAMLLVFPNYALMVWVGVMVKLVALQNEAPPLPPYGDPASSDGNEPTDTTIPAPPPRD